MQTVQVSESSVRRLARRSGYFITKSRRALSMDNGGEYRLVNADSNRVVLGERYDATLADIADWFHED